MPHLPLIKKTDWAERLAGFFAAQAGGTFAYGVKDCCLFVADGVQAMTGADLMADYRGRYNSEEEIKQIVAEENASCLTALIRRRLKDAGLRVKEAGFAMRGDIALLDEGAMGLVSMDGRHVVVLHLEQATHHVPLSRIKLLWGVE